MIQKVTAYKSSDDKTFGTLEEVQRHELQQMFLAPNILPDAKQAATMNESQAAIFVSKNIASIALENSEKLVDILTTTSKSRPAARAANGATRKRKPKSTPVVAAVGENGPVER